MEHSLTENSEAIHMRAIANLQEIAEKSKSADDNYPVNVFGLFEVLQDLVLSDSLAFERDESEAALNIRRLLQLSLDALYDADFHYELTFK